MQRFSFLSSILLISLLLVSCSTTAPLEENIETTSIDLTRFTDRGFIITPSSYPGEFQSVGFVTVSLEPRAKSISGGERPSGMVKGAEFMTATVYYEPLDLNKALEAMYQKATYMGGDGIINFSREFYTVTYKDAEIPAVRLSGFAIDRTEETASTEE